jgi:hypothetical protein
MTSYKYLQLVANLRGTITDLSILIARTNQMKDRGRNITLPHQIENNFCLQKNDKYNINNTKTFFRGIDHHNVKFKNSLKM